MWYFNSQIWLLPALSQLSKQKLLSASAAPLKLITVNYDRMISHEGLHYLNQRATRDQMTIYKHALLLHKIYNNKTKSIDWTNLFFNQHFDARCNFVQFYNAPRYKIGNNVLANRCTVLIGKIELHWLNETPNTFKIKCKGISIPNNKN